MFSLFLLASCLSATMPPLTDQNKTLLTPPPGTEKRPIPTCLKPTEPKTETFPLMNPVSNKITWDFSMSPYAGGEGLLFAGRSLEKIETYLLSSNPNAYSSASYAKFWRLSELISIWLPLNYFSMILQHEVFGHGYRIRDLFTHNVAKMNEYHFSWPPPYGPGGAFTSFYLSNRFTTTADAAVSGAGVEASAILAILTKEKWIQSKTVDPRQAVLYLVCQHDLPLYIGTLKEKFRRKWQGHDLTSYIFALNSTYPEHFLSKGRLRSLSWINLADPFTAYAIYSWFHYLSSGKETPLPMIASCYLPGFRLGLTPFGPQVFSEHFFRRKNSPIYAYFSGGCHANNTYLGAGVYAPSFWSLHKWSCGFRLDLWYQPKLLLQPGAIPFFNLDFEQKPSKTNPLYPPSQQHAMLSGIGGSLISAYQISSSSGYEIEIGYKSSGFLPGYSLYSFPTLRFNCTVNF